MRYKVRMKILCCLRVEKEGGKEKGKLLFDYNDVRKNMRGNTLR